MQYFIHIAFAASHICIRIMTVFVRIGRTHAHIRKVAHLLQPQGLAIFRRRLRIPSVFYLINGPGQMMIAIYLCKIYRLYAIIFPGREHFYVRGGIRIVTGFPACKFILYPLGRHVKIANLIGVQSIFFRERFIAGFEYFLLVRNI